MNIQVATDVRDSYADVRRNYFTYVRNHSNPERQR